MNSAKAYLGLMARIFREKGLETVVFSPGSRNAPLIRTFTAVHGIRCLSLADERSAAHFALGIALTTGRPVAVACTSGTAALNYAPAIAEAFYQHLPLLVLTADRPAEWVDQGDGQAIRQENLYANYIKKYFRYPQHVTDEEDVKYIMHLANEAYESALLPEAGPVHINFPFTDPLYGFSPDLTTPPRIMQIVEKIPSPEETLVKTLAGRWNRAGKKMILTGMMPAGHGLAATLQPFAEDPSVIVLSETTSNLDAEGDIAGIDKVVSTFTEKEADAFAPDLLITAGGHVVSKMIKRFLRDHPPAEHWHISPSGTPMDTFHALTQVIRSTAETFFTHFIPLTDKGTGDYAARWQQRDQRSAGRHEAFLEKAPFSDLKAFDLILRELPGGITLHLANSTPVRYSQLFPVKKKFRYHSNRGVSGIDGCLSTAAGAALDNGEDTVLLTGDIAFFYDQNGLWHKHLSDKLKIIVINNGGGGIFRFIEGPDSTDDLDFFETPHNLTARHVAALYGISYLQAENEDSLKKGLHTLSSSHSPVILEIFTPREKNGEILREYFRYLKEGGKNIE
jgi:2-succinyl-5-enolpyruvyl-6-hydroxy-3-cyclohexene-1-carboxylate synthase